MMEKITSKTELLERIKDVRAVEMLARRRYAEDTVIFKNSEITKTISDIIKDDDKHIRLLTELVNLLEKK